MANLWTGKINTNGNYVNLATETGLTFINDNWYQIQMLNPAYIREGEIGEGFLKNDIKPFLLQYKGDNVYINTFGFGCGINISEYKL